MTRGSRREQVRQGPPAVFCCLEMLISFHLCWAAMPLGGTVEALTTDNPDNFSEEQEELQVYEKHNNLLHGSKRKK